MDNMRLIPVGSLQAGMKLGKKIYNEDGVVLLSENAELTDAIIRRLKSHGLDFVYIADPRTDDVVVNDMIEDETRRHALSEIRTQFRNWATPAVKGVVYPYLGKKFTGVIESILDDLSARNDAMIMMMNINSMDHYLYRHSLNVCVYTLLLGQIHGYSKDELTMLGLGAMLHDVGKTKLPLSLLNKPSRLTDEEFKQIQLHPELGFKMLKDEPGIPLISAHCAYQHHEKIDGSGYPRGCGARRSTSLPAGSRLRTLTTPDDAPRLPQSDAAASGARGAVRRMRGLVRKIEAGGFPRPGGDLPVRHDREVKYGRKRRCGEN
ncbi:hypothetical protein HMSSN036_47300 [Paenibacillus macerans]|nr:hypothetical protein HMSSN036_47300 [Paenibacillus macerans]